MTGISTRKGWSVCTER